MQVLEKIDSLPTVEGKLRAVKEAQAAFFRKSLYLTCRSLLGMRDIDWECHGSMIESLENRQTLRKLIVMPRGTFKSSVCSIGYPIWSLLNNYDLRVLIDSELYTNSSNFLREIKQHLASPKMVELYGEFENRGCWNEGEIIIKQRKKVVKEASITCSGIGAQKTSQHYDLIIADDMNSPKNSMTPEGRQKVIDHFKYYTSLLEPGGTIVVVGTRYADDDLIGWIEKNEINRKGLM